MDGVCRKEHQRGKTVCWSGLTPELNTTMSLSSFFSSFLGTLHADASEESKVTEAEPQEVEEVAAEAEEEEPEDVRLLHSWWMFCH